MGDKKEFLETVEGFKDPLIQGAVSEVRERDPLDSLKSTLFEFFQKRLTNLQNEEAFKTTIKAALLEKIETGETSFNQLMQLYKEIQMSNTKAVDSILDILKPAPAGTVSLLVTPKNEDEIEDKFSALSPSERDSISKLANLVNKLSQEGEDNKKEDV